MTNTETIAVDCRFDPDGAVHVRRIALEGRWQAIEQGRQWLDEQGRHVLVMIGSDVHQITLGRKTLAWQLRRRPQPRIV